MVRVGDEVVVRRANEERTKFGEYCRPVLRCFIPVIVRSWEVLLTLDLQIGKVLQLLRRSFSVKEDEKLEFNVR